jgi:hypothetical protein
LIFKAPLEERVSVRSFGPLDEGPNPFFQVKGSTENKNIPDADCVDPAERVGCRLHAPRGPAKGPQIMGKIQLDPAGEVQRGGFTICPPLAGSL